MGGDQPRDADDNPLARLCGAMLEAGEREPGWTDDIFGVIIIARPASGEPAGEGHRDSAALAIGPEDDDARWTELAAMLLAHLRASPGVAVSPDDIQAVMQLRRFN